MNFKGLKKNTPKPPVFQEPLPNPDEGVFKVAGNIITEELMKDAVMKVLIEELKTAVSTAGRDSEIAVNARNAVVKRYELLTTQNTATIGDLMASAKGTRATKTETAETEDFDITSIAPHQGELVVVSIVNPNTETMTVNTRKGKVTVPNMFKYVVSDGTTANNDTIHGIMVHYAKGISFDTRRKIKNGSVIKGILDWDPTKERYTLINVEIVQEAESVGNPISILNEWLQKHTMFDMEGGNVKKMSWTELTRMVQNIHPRDISVKLTELFPGGIILAEGRGNSRFYYTEKSTENKA